MGKMRLRFDLLGITAMVARPVEQRAQMIGVVAFVADQPGADHRNQQRRCDRDVGNVTAGHAFCKSSADRLPANRAATLNHQLGGEGLSTWADPPAKPKWMRRRTYEKKFAASESIVERANRVFTIQTMRIVRPPAVSIRINRSRRL
jgi:hypothetical protein